MCNRFFCFSLLSILLLLVQPFDIRSQTIDRRAFDQIAVDSGIPGWVDFKTESRLDPVSLLNTNKSAFGLTEKDEARLVRQESDQLGFTHYRFNQYFEEVEVEGAEFLVHSRNGIAEKGNGALATGLGLSTNPSIQPAQALQIALDFVGAESYMWEDPLQEATLRRVKGDSEASWYPEAKLLIADKDFDGQNEPVYRLAYKFEIYASRPHQKLWVYVDAQSGEIFKTLDVLMHTDTEGLAETRYRGTRRITTDSTANGYVLRETGRGGGIETLDMNTLKNFSLAEDFVDADNYWNNANAQFDDAATDAHWGMEMTYDYFLLNHNRNSFDNSGSPLLSYVHYDSGYFNAFWNGSWCTFGDGGGNPLTTLDIVAHEMAHGVTGNSAGLIYSYESGALNESFSDIFGNAIEYFADSSLANWRLGEDLGNALRSMSDPNFYLDPDTYGGLHYWDLPGDNGGVHTNSGVQNYWFYLMVEGGSGINDKGDSFTVSGLGWEKAAAIAYRNLTVYLTSHSQFKDAREGSIQAAIDLYGICSNEFIQTASAWYAVGVGGPIMSGDFGVISMDAIPSCGSSDQEEIRIKVKYFGCDTLASTSMQVAFFLDNPFSTVVEFLNLPNGVAGQQVIDYTFSQKADLSNLGAFTILSRTISTSDPYHKNDSSDFVHVFRSAPAGSTLIGFETFGTNQAVLDSFYTIVASQANVSVSPEAARTGTYGLLMEGGDFNLAAPPSPGQDPFLVNPEFRGEACFCVDATNFSDLSVEFDLRQTFSTYYQTLLGMPVPGASLVRVRANQQELNRYIPFSNTSDLYLRKTLNLNPFAGTRFTLCFESKSVMSKALDPDGIGDRILIDNISFNGQTISTGIDDPKTGFLSVVPNPAFETVTLSLSNSFSGQAEVILLDLSGRMIRNWTWEKDAGRSDISLALPTLPSGLYLMEVRVGNQRLSKKLMIR
jgi:Zn-dependent metalloprotease